MSARRKTLTTPEVTLRANGGGAPSITISTDAVDGYRDRILQAGLTFRDPLPVLFAHSYQDLPVGQAMAETITRGPTRTTASWRWLEGDERAARVRNAFEQGFLGASVGLLVGDATPNQHGGYDIREAEVTEFSLTATPANPDCVRLLKDLGLGRPAVPARRHIVEWEDLILDDEAAEDLEVDDDLAVTPKELVAAMRTVLPGLVDAALRPALREFIMQRTGRVD